VKTKSLLKLVNSFDPYNQTIPGVTGMQHVQAAQLIKLTPSSTRGDPELRKKKCCALPLNVVHVFLSVKVQ
jgi:hypothetical protein